MRGNAGDLYGSRGDVDKEQYVLSDETDAILPKPHFKRAR
jgi:hypothetical protein